MPALRVIPGNGSRNQQTTTMIIKIRYGLETLERHYPSTPTIGQIKNDPNVKAGLGFGDNVKALINGIEQPDTVGVPENQVVVIETAANEKA